MYTAVVCKKHAAVHMVPSADNIMRCCCGTADIMNRVVARKDAPAKRNRPRRTLNDVKDIPKQSHGRYFDEASQEGSSQPLLTRRSTADVPLLTKATSFLQRLGMADKHPALPEVGAQVLADEWQMVPSIWKVRCDQCHVSSVSLAKMMLHGQFVHH